MIDLSTRALARRWMNALLHIKDSPERTAAAFAIGVFVGFSPLLGFHTLLGILVAFLFNLNRVAVLLGVYMNLPWFLAPYYAIATMAGAEVTGHRLPPDLRTQFGALFEESLLHGEFWRQLFVIMRPFVWPFTVGSTLCALVLAMAAYQLALAFVTNRRRIHGVIHPHHKPEHR
jgi:uncharacterized protein (DUF2062 family)